MYPGLIKEVKIMACGGGGFFGENSEVLFFILIFLLLFYNTGYGYGYGYAQK
jgi:hypothetical protein